MESVSTFSRPVKAFLVTKFLAYTQSAFAQFLINIYFWRITQNVPFLVLFNAIFIVAHTLAYLPAGKIAKEYDRFLPLRIGMLLQLVYLGAIMYLGEHVTSFIIPVAIIGGIGHGAYWFSDNLLKSDLTNPENRLKFSAAFQILQNIASGLMPLIASVLVATDGGVFHAYGKVFMLAILSALLVFISSFFISGKKVFQTKKLSILSTWKRLLKDRNIRISCWSTFFSYISDALPVLIGLLLYILSGSELSLGGYQFITVALTVLTFYLAGRYLSRKYYRRMLIWGGIGEFALIFILFISQSYGAIILYGILKALLAFTFAPTYIMTQDAFNMYAATQDQYIGERGEYIILQEVCVGAGRVFGFLVLLLLYKSMNPWLIGSVVTIFAFTDLLANLIITKIKDGKYQAIDLMN